MDRVKKLKKTLDTRLTNVMAGLRLHGLNAYQCWQLLILHAGL